MWPFVVTFIIGVLFAVFGFRLLFQKGYVERWMEGSWKTTKFSVLEGRHAYYYYKYGRGISSLAVGIIMMGFVIYMLVKAYLGEISI